jgi:hypothetical protein
MPDDVKSLDATDITQIVAALQAWINGLGILDNHLWLEYIEESTGLGMCIKANGGNIAEEDIDGSFSAEIPFIVYITVNSVPDGAAAAYKPLNDLGAWFKANGPLGLDIGERRTPDLITMTRAPMDMSGKDESGNATFLATYNLTYYEEAQL